LFCGGYKMLNFIYSTLLLVTLAYPLYRFHEPRLRMKKNVFSVFLSVSFVAVFFIGWDIVFAINKLWNFNPRFVTGVSLFYLPLEEWLFFFVIPYSCLFIYEVVNYFFPEMRSSCLISAASILFALFLLIAAILNTNRLYTLVSFSSGSVVMLILVVIPFYRKQLALFWLSWFFCLIPFFFVNGVLTALPVVSYAAVGILNIRIFSIPVEDFIYSHALLFLNFALYNYLIRNKR